jgi:predicted dehydrogenase
VRIAGDKPAKGTLKAVLFGLGNYAKVCMLPYLHKRIKVGKIHEVDPLQMMPISRWRCHLDTSPVPRADDKSFDVFFIAGFHHTHASIAEFALRSDAYAVVEKPLVTTRTQFDRLRRAMSDHPGRLFACFQRRFAPYNAWLRKDLGVADDDPINYHCLVYEIPSPAKHWYTWPNSCSRIVSNACHWIDHFMFLNASSPWIRADIQRAGESAVFVLIELDNGAVFSMVLTEAGSDRLGMRDYIELRTRKATVTIADGKRYRAENRSRILRTRQLNQMRSYQRMYHEISSRIVEGRPGDSLESLRASELCVELDDRLRESSAAKREASVGSHAV